MENLALDHVYLCGPQLERTADWNPVYFAAAEQLRMTGFTVINPAAQSPKASLQEAGRFDLISLLEHCYAVVLLPGWDESPASLAAVYAASTFGIPTVDISNEVGLRRLLRDRSATPSHHQAVLVRDLPRKDPTHV